MDEVENALKALGDTVTAFDTEVNALKESTLFSDEYKQHNISLAQGRAIIDSEKYLPQAIEAAWQNYMGAAAEVNSAAATARNPGQPLPDVLPLLRNEIALSGGSGKAFLAKLSSMAPAVQVAAGLALAGELLAAGIKKDLEWDRAVRAAERELEAKVASDPAYMKAQQRAAAAHETMRRTVEWAAHLNGRFGTVSPTIHALATSVVQVKESLPNDGSGGGWLVSYQRREVSTSLATETDEQRRKRLKTDKGPEISPLFGQSSGETDESRRARLYGGKMGTSHLFGNSEKD